MVLFWGYMSAVDDFWENRARAQDDVPLKLFRRDDMGEAERRGSRIGNSRAGRGGAGRSGVVWGGAESVHEKGADLFACL